MQDKLQFAMNDIAKKNCGFAVHFLYLHQGRIHEQM